MRAFGVLSAVNLFVSYLGAHDVYVYVNREVHEDVLSWLVIFALTLYLRGDVQPSPLLAVSVQDDDADDILDDINYDINSDINCDNISDINYNNNRDNISDNITNINRDNNRDNITNNHNAI